MTPIDAACRHRRFQRRHQPAGGLRVQVRLPLDHAQMRGKFAPWPHTWEALTVVYALVVETLLFRELRTARDLLRTAVVLEP